MANAYRKFELYQANLKRFLTYTKKLKNFEVRIYTDNTGKDFVLKASEIYPEVTVLKYDCEPFREGDGHTGVFGMMPRFLPLFEKGLDIVWVSDIDLDESFITMERVNLINRKNSDIFISSAFCYQRKPWIRDRQPYSIQAGAFISKFTFSKQLLTNFLQKVIDGTYDNVIDSINEYNKHTLTVLKFPYGMDEYFMNTSILTSIKRHDLNVIIRTDFFTRNFLIYNIDKFPQEYVQILDRYYRTYDKRLFNKVIDIYKKYIPMLVKDFPCAQSLLDNIDKFNPDTAFLLYFEVSSKDI